MLRDDLLHPVLGGNKVRKLDALLPQLLAEGVTDVLTCGGVQSAHTAAVAVAAAEAGLRSHLLVRGEKPQVPTGYHLVTRMYGSEVSYVSRAEYADRPAMMTARADALRRRAPGAKVAVVAEGGGEPAALLGLLRLVHWLAAEGRGGGSGGGGSSSSTSGTATTAGIDGRASHARRVVAVERLHRAAATPYRLVVDSGTGTAAIGLALAVSLLGLPWSVHAVMLAGDEQYYNAQQQQLLAGFMDLYGAELYGGAEGAVAAVGGVEEAGSAGAAEAGEAMAARLPLRWLPRRTPRRFGKVLHSDIEACKQVAQQYGIGLDPVYSLAAWELAAELAEAELAAELAVGAEAGSKAAEAEVEAGGAGGERPHLHPRVLVVHGGGALGLHGLAQRYPDWF
ncbi:hypothetical protein GPECTOR_71g563 [Gonium pectorale]|uniref:Tryptophan synthase beta chain-like PALP domain-containing protein n=1 Tax=Gonium pectorale TaxID=33097 RepID=A0A150G2V4_GONPE|nr:hypothetical protein GPECTOR_71g563 [Gonium pectorale]|eukprot:KXZ44202.1 hypothetical protein GPECTOR_71g563 [Gonium pectorale]